MNAEPKFADAQFIEKSIALAKILQQRASALQTPSERRQQSELDRMLQTPEDKATLVQLTDQAFRARRAARVADQFTYILDVQGIPRFFSPLDRVMLKGFKAFGGWLPGVSVPLVKEHMRHETTNVVLPAEEEHLRGHLRARQAEGVRMNLNFLGEALLGEEEATRRLVKYRDALRTPEVEVLSVKISTLYSQISALAREHTLAVLCERLEALYREAAAQRFIHADGTAVPKFVYLDMEEYRDLHLTAEAFMRTLSRSGLENVSAGIALQAYIPDSARVQQTINAWARQRVAAGGAPVTIRIVKGANMEMERVEASQHGWPQAPYKTKRETDANYKRMLREALRPENLAAVRVGVASHNLFDVAYALVLASAVQPGNRVQFEMLEGMANHQRRALLEQSKNLLLYAPACRREEFLNAIGYLIRRLDENTGPENFLRHAFRLTPDSEDWRLLERGFSESCEVAATVSDAPRRSQDRNSERFERPVPEMPWNRFSNEPDTDWSLQQNSQWAEKLVARREPSVTSIPLVIAGEAIAIGNLKSNPCRDPSRPDVAVARYLQANDDDVDRAVACAMADPDGWRGRSMDERSEVLGRVAVELRKARGDLLLAALANGGKILSESDPEVSEAIDFVEFYRAAAKAFFELPTLAAEGRGVVVVAPPWNFPIAIPCGGVAAALAAGNTVILKPASDAVLIAWELCQCFWRGGISKNILQFVPCAGSGPGARLAGHPDVSAVILTGGTETAQRMLAKTPAIRLYAETGGKNATIVTALSDRELAIKHILHSAFSHSGQKCSATSLLLLEREVYEDAGFRRMFADAVRSLDVAGAWELRSRVGPLIHPPGEDLSNALQRLEPGESWEVAPQASRGNPSLWSPAVKWGVKRGSYTHLTEFFGPVLAVMPFDSLDEAIEIVNQTGYGLTSGLHSLDNREIQEWKAGIHAGNLYINRSTVGAIVLRQPFGGMGRSCFGPGIKAGGPNYVAQFMRLADREDQGMPKDVPLQNQDLEDMRRAVRLSLAGREDGGAIPHAVPLLRALASYDKWWQEEFNREHDHFRLLGQDNVRRYLPFAMIRVRLSSEDSAFDIFARVAAARATGARVIISHPPYLETHIPDQLREVTHSWDAPPEFVTETDDALALHIAALLPHTGERLRYAAPDRVPQRLRAAAATAAVYLADEPVLAEGRVELLWYLREQSISHDYHRYGNLGARAAERREEPE